MNDLKQRTSYYMLDIAFSDTKENFVTNARPRRDIYHIVALSHTCLKNHFIRQFGDKTPIYRKIIELYEKGQTEVLYKALEVSLSVWINYLESETENGKLENIESLLISKQYFLRVLNSTLALWLLKKPKRFFDFIFD